MIVAYCRVSTQKQGASGLGLEAQRAAITRYAGAEPILAWFTEIESGKLADRPELRKALALARSKGATLVVAKLDRLGRNMAFVARVLESGVEFRAADMPEANRFMLHVMAALAEYEAKLISERTKAALAAYKERGGKLGSARTGGVPSEEAQRRGRETNQRAAREYAAVNRPTLQLLRDSGMTLQEIADRLNQEGRLTRRGKRWYPSSVLALLRATGCAPIPRASDPTAAPILRSDAFPLPSCA